jgi:hypothetical protein
MKTPTRPQLSQLASGASRRGKALVILALLAIVLALVCLAVGCSTTQSGLDREQHLYSIATNAVAAVEKRVVPALPPPVASIAEPLLALAAAGLAAWNTWQHKQIRGLQNGQNGKSIAVAPAPTQPPGA